MIRLRLLAVPLFAAACGYAAAQPPSIQELGVLDLVNPNSIANGVSADGATVVGQSQVGPNQHAFRWRAGSGMVDLGTLEALGTSSAEDVSDNGQVVVGDATVGGINRAFRWTSGGGMVDLGALGGPAAPSAALAVSANGNVVVGNSGNSSEGTSPFRWTSGGGMVDLGSFAGAAGFATAEGVSDNGAVVVGYGDAPANESRRVAFRWQGGNMEDLSLPGYAISAITCVSGDGRFMGGVNSKLLPTAGYRTSLWKSNGAVDIYSSLGTSLPTGISQDGKVLVGLTLLETDGSPLQEATVWINGKAQPLASLLASEGVDLSAWSALNNATAVSENGRVVVGQGTVHPDGAVMAFRAVLPNRGPSLQPVKVGKVTRLANDVRVTLSAKTVDPDSASLKARWRVEGALRKTQNLDPGKTTTFTFDYQLGETPILLTLTDNDKTATIEGILRITENQVRFIVEESSAEAASDESSLAANGSSLDAYRLSGLAVGSATSEASLSGYRYAESAILAELYADEAEGSTGDAAIAYGQLRFAQAAYSQVAAEAHLAAFAETGDEAQLFAAVRWQMSAGEALDALTD